MRRDSVRTPAPGTDTTHGRIPHLRLVTSLGVLDAPVAVQVFRIETDTEVGYRLRPKMNEFGRYLHVLPGGGLIPGSHASAP